jgi:subtilisin family serine protease
VLDSGIKLDHEDLEDRLWRNPNEFLDGVDNDGNGYPDDVVGWDFVNDDNEPSDGTGQGHGTFVSGIIGAQANNSIGIAGVAWNIRIMPVKVANDAEVPEASVSDIADGIRYAAKNGARVINLSVQGACGFRYAEIVSAINDVRSLYATIVVVSAGNSSLNCVPLGVIAVGASAGPVRTEGPSLTCDLDQPTIDVNKRAIFTPDGALGSNWGPEIDFAAPGQCVTSTSNGQSLGLYNNLPQGTSFAAPFVSGLIALLLSQDPTRTEAHIRTILCATAVNLPDGNTPNWDGCGRIDIGRALTQEPYQSLVPGITKP